MYAIKSEHSSVMMLQTMNMKMLIMWRFGGVGVDVADA